MGLRKDLDKKGVRYLYLLKDGEKVIYVGTAKNPQSRFKSHLKRSKTENALIYQYIRKNSVVLKMEVVKKLIGTYEQAEMQEIELIKRYQLTCLNFYNNPNKKHYYEVEKQLTL